MENNEAGVVILIIAAAVIMFIGGSALGTNLQMNFHEKMQ